MSNKTEILSFDEWYKEAKKLNNDGFSAKDFFEAGQQSRQDEVDELQKNFNNALKTIDIQQQFLDDTDGTIKIITSQVDELQNRIDELKMANHNLSVMTAEAESYSDYWKYELDKLQKRIDRAVEHIEDYYGVVGLSMIVDILKGEETK